MNLASGAGAFLSESPGTVPLMTAPHGCHSGRQSVSFSRAAVTLTPRDNGGTEPKFVKYPGSEFVVLVLIVINFL